MSEGPLEQVKAWLGRLTTGDRVVYGAVLVLLLLAVIGQPVWRSVDLRLDMTLRQRDEGAAYDPWGRSYEEVHGAVWSGGPNAAFEHGTGDDIRLYYSDEVPLVLYRALRPALLLLAVLLACLWELGRVLRRPRNPELPRELLLALGVALPLATLLSIALVVFVLPLLVSREVLQEAESRLLVPIDIAIAGSTFAVCYLAILWVRLRQPVQSEEPSSQAPPRADTRALGDDS